MPIAGITLRNTKGSELSFAELDGNFTALSDAITNLFTATVTVKGIRETVYNHGNVSGTVVPDTNSGTVHKMVLTGTTTINTLGNVSTGSGVTLILQQDATGSRTLSSTMKFANGNKTLSTTASATDIISVFYDGTNYLASLSKGYS